MLDALRTSGTGLLAQKFRMNIITQNLANANTTGYRRKDVIFGAFESFFPFASAVEGAKGVSVLGMTEDKSDYQMVYDPHHPAANGEGYVEMPNIDPVVEMVNLITASRAYEANLVAISVTKSMALKSTEI